MSIVYPTESDKLIDSAKYKFKTVLPDREYKGDKEYKRWKDAVCSYDVETDAFYVGEPPSGHWVTFPANWGATLELVSMPEERPLYDDAHDVTSEESALTVDQRLAYMKTLVDLHGQLEKELGAIASRAPTTLSTPERISAVTANKDSVYNEINQIRKSLNPHA